MALLTKGIDSGISYIGRCNPTRKTRSGSCCLQLDKPPKRPDPAIYSQSEEMSAGREPNWNSPDITTNHWGPWRLFSEPEVTVRNLSTSVSAINTHVHLSISAFGIGMTRTQISSQVLNLAPNQTSLLKFPLPQAIRDGDQSLSTHVTIEHATDANVTNNKGEQSIHGVETSDVGRNLSFQFPVRNPLATPQNMTLTLLANDVGAAVSPAAHNFAAFEQITATLTLAIPGSWHPAGGEDLRREITVIGWDASARMVGGITYIVRIDD